MRSLGLNNHKPYLLVLPALIFFSLFVLYGIGTVFAESLNLSLNTGSSIVKYYIELAEKPGFWSGLILSLQVSAAATLLSIIIGVYLARQFYRRVPDSIWHALAWLPMLIPHFAAGYLAVPLLSQSGWFSGLLAQVTLIQETSRFPVLVNDKNGLGIIVTYLWKEIPFVLLMSMPVYRRMDWRYEDVVRTLGGGQWQVFKTVEWPALLPVLVETGIILFAFIFSAFELPYLLGVTYPKMISVMAYQWFYEGSWSNRPLAMALMTVSTVMVLIVAVVLLGLIQGKRYRMMRGR